MSPRSATVWLRCSMLRSSGVYPEAKMTDPIDNDGNNEVDAAVSGAAHEPEDMGAFTGWILLFGFSALFAILAFLV